MHKGIQNIRSSILELQSQAQDSNTSEVENSLQKELDELLRREEILWRDKANSKWLQEGDANTRYFHLTTIIHRRYNSINSLLSSNNVWLSHRQAIGMTFQTYYSNLFTSVEPQYLEDFQNLRHPIIEQEDNDKLKAIPYEDEIRKAVFSMGSNKSLRPIGITTNFYKATG